VRKLSPNVYRFIKMYVEHPFIRKLPHEMERDEKAGLGLLIT
jgi:hypothetical protein